MEMTIASSLVVSFVDYAAKHGVDRSTMLSAGSLSETDLQDPDARISADSYGAVIGTAIKLTGDTGLPMRHAADQRLEHLSSADTVRRETNALRVHPYWVTFQKENTPQYALNLFVDHANALLASLKDTETLRARVEEQILRELHKGPVARDRVARELGVSERTLHRRLRGEGMTYAEVYDSVRDRMAREYLKTDRVTLAEVAFLLGFSESSAFVRAFRRWTEFSPSDFRQSMI